MTLAPGNTKGGKFKMALGKKKEDIESIEPVEENITLADIVETEEDKKILEPVSVPVVKRNTPFVIGTVSVASAFLRKEPYIYADIVSFLKKGDTVIINDTGSIDDYFYVTANNTVGYISKSDITVN